jgi:integrase
MRKAAGLTTLTVKSAKPGRYGDGNGLYLLVREGGARWWLFRYHVNGKMREMGLGAAPSPAREAPKAAADRETVSLAEARDKARALRDIVRAGGDPLAQRDADAAVARAEAQQAAVKAMTFRAVANAYLAAHEAGWHNPKHRAQWRATLDAYAMPHMGDLPVSDVMTGHVMAALEPIWTAKPETATRVRGRIEAVLDYAAARGWRSGENPARWRGHVANLLPSRGKLARVVHHAALPWEDVAAFLADLRGRPGMGARALEFTILTAARTGEALGTRWGEIDLTEGVWTVPAERMKAGREHRVPLSDAALAIVRTLLPLRPPDDDKGRAFVFPGARKGRPLSGMAMLMLLRRMERGDLTAHGFRSSFRDWAAERTSYAREVAEEALAHTLRDKTEAAYRRGDLFEKRRRLMDDWAAFCAKPAAEGANVTPIRASV